jgi:competence protein ComEA
MTFVMIKSDIYHRLHDICHVENDKCHFIFGGLSCHVVTNDICSICMSDITIFVCKNSDGKARRGNMRRRYQIVWGVILGIIVLAASWKIFIPTQTGVVFEQKESNQVIVVHMTGAVNTPGIVTLPLDSRLSDALAVAGLHEDADSDVINLAQKLKDGQRVYIPFRGENIDVYDDEDGTGTGGYGSTSQSQRSGTGSGSGSGATQGGKVNINSASASQLRTLPGIGPVLAERIIAYRQANGMFMSEEELKNVSGIGPKSYEQLADLITVGP